MSLRFNQHRTLAVAAFLIGTLAASGYGQFGQQEGLPPAMMVIPPNRETLQALRHAREALKQNRTADAFQLLQRLIELPEDYFTDKSMQQTLKSETLRMLTELTSSERQAYELLQGASARDLLTEARAAGDTQRLEEVVRRFPLTQASFEAAETLAIQAFDRGEIARSAEQFSQLRTWPIAPADHARRLAVREALARHLTGQDQRAAEILNELTSSSTVREKVAGESLPVFADKEHAGRWLAQITGPSRRDGESDPGNWLSSRGSPSGTVPRRLTGPIGGPLWHAPHLSALEAELSSSSDDLLLQRLADAEAPLKEAEQLTWPTTAPLIIGDLMVFRTARDVVALDARTGEVRWRSVLSDPDFDQQWSQDSKSADGPDDARELSQYLRERLFEDASFGALGSDGHLVFALEGLSLESSPVANEFNRIRVFNPDEVVEPRRFNRLTAYELQGGRLAWEVGGERNEGPADFAGHYFLGTPLACDGHLFLLAECQGEIRLLALETTPDGVRKVWSQPLVAPTLKITETDDRRHQALTPACANRIVVCPTEAGVVIAVDVALRRLVWAYQYQSSEAAAQEVMNMRRAGAIFRNTPEPVEDRSDQGWLDGNPIIADGRVFITPTDSDELHCLNLADGKGWKIPRERGVYLAGADGKRAVIVSPDQIDAVRVADGSPEWSVPIPAPTGRGVWMPDRYLVPLSTGEIATLDLERGRLLARSKLPGGTLPGNLAANSQFLVSLSARDAVAFRSLDETEGLITRALAADSTDAAALALRGEVRLHLGEFEAGLADLRASIAKRPDPYAKSVLAAALLDGLRTDFARYRDTVTELETLTDDAQQHNEFVWLVARGLKETGQSLAAFERMTHLIEQSLDDFSTEGSESAWQSRNDRRLSGLFAALYRQAGPDDRRKLDAQILEWLPKTDALPEAEVVTTLRRYLRVYDFHPSAVSVRQQLVSRLDSELNSLEYVWELSRLANSSDVAVAGPSAGTLARWYLKRQRFDDVEASLADLEGRLADASCEPGISGRQLAEQLRADEGFLEARQRHTAWPDGNILTHVPNQPNQGGRMHRVVVEGRVPAHYEGWSFETDQQQTLLIARDDMARQRWVLQRANAAAAVPVFGTDAQPAHHRVHLCGHLIGWSMGTSFLVAADLEPQRAPPRVIWQESLLPLGGYSSEQNRTLAIQQARNMARRRQVLLNQPFVYNLPGALVAMTDDAVIYHNGRKLFAADPLTGQLLWSRRDLSRSLLEIQADEQAVSILVQDAPPNNDGTTSVQLLRTTDGEAIPAADLPPGIVEWIGGSRVLISEDPARPGAGPVPLALQDVAGGELLWRAELARPAAISVRNQSEIFTLEENRRLTVRNLSDGAIRWTQELSLDVNAESLLVQRWKDRYLVIAGITSLQPAQPGTPRVLGFDSQHVPIFGHVAALKRDTGELLWQRPINEPATDPTAFDISQPAGWPVLVFAGRMYVSPQPGAVVPGFAAQQGQRLTVTLIDKATGQPIYSREEPSNIQLYFVEVDPDRNRLTANFLTWSVELHYTGKRRK